MVDIENEYREQMDEELVQNLQNELQEHKDRLKDKEHQIDELMAERDEYKTAYAESAAAFPWFHRGEHQAIRQSLRKCLALHSSLMAKSLSSRTG
ncbi:uncharacterized protein ACHE_10882S [Aspergillus chevalieri]|uniref:Uncharacterized protein n=1 Tax=Aspergillus chevalieri TaxID=182096 RepID=A0A7R7ZIB2_ASPCH|nr:uncharacterized protein ACHE_10882S [Aspergillus chevalieri]BCR83480.1 hypothetical protein ACHE_10882S [Aspergillus chevalieri]